MRGGGGGGGDRKINGKISKQLVTLFPNEKPFVWPNFGYDPIYQSGTTTSARPRESLYTTIALLLLNLHTRMGQYTAVDTPNLTIADSVCIKPPHTSEKRTVIFCQNFENEDRVKRTISMCTENTRGYF